MTGGGAGSGVGARRKGQHMATKYDVALARPLPIDTDRVGIPTVYKGRTYRSRLEARWAAMFDLLRWRAEYEEIDLAGYIPDFIVHFKRGKLLVEVKPALEFADLHEHAKRICQSGWRGDFMVVGAQLFDAEGDRNRRSFGLLAMWDRDFEDGWQPADHACAIHCRMCRKTTIKHASGAWFCVACGACDPRVHFEDEDAGKLDAMWAKAGDITQWQPRKGRRGA